MSERSYHGATPRSHVKSINTFYKVYRKEGKIYRKKERKIER